MAEKSFGLPRQERVRKRTDYDRVFQNGRKIAEGAVFARYIENHLGRTRMGTAIPRRFGNAVRRNRAKRLLKEAYRLHKHDFPQGIDIIFLPGHHWDTPRLPELETDIIRIGERLRERGEGK